MNLDSFKKDINKICIKIIDICCICIKRIQNSITYNGGYGIKPNQTKHFEVVLHVRNVITHVI